MKKLMAIFVVVGALSVGAAPVKYMDIDTNWQQAQELEDLHLQQGASMALRVRPKIDGRWLDLTGTTARWEAREVATNASAYTEASSLTSNEAHWIQIDLDSSETGTSYTNWLYSVVLVYGGADYPIGVGRVHVWPSAWAGASAELVGSGYETNGVATPTISTLNFGSGISAEYDGTNKLTVSVLGTTDDLGDHTATQDLDMGGFSVTNVADGSIGFAGGETMSAADITRFKAVTNAITAETDPIWITVSNTVTAGAALGATALQAESQGLSDVLANDVDGDDLTITNLHGIIVDGAAGGHIGARKQGGFQVLTLHASDAGANGDNKSGIVQMYNENSGGLPGDLLLGAATNAAGGILFYTGNPPTLRGKIDHDGTWHVGGGDVTNAGTFYGNGSGLTGITATEMDPEWSAQSNSFARTSGFQMLGNIDLNAYTLDNGVVDADQLAIGTIPASAYGASVGTTNAITSAGLLDISALLGGGGGGATALSELTDATISALVSNDVLAWDGATWTNSPRKYAYATQSGTWSGIDNVYDADNSPELAVSLDPYGLIETSGSLDHIDVPYDGRWYMARATLRISSVTIGHDYWHQIGGTSVDIMHSLHRLENIEQASSQGLTAIVFVRAQNSGSDVYWRIKKSSGSDTDATINSFGLSLIQL